MALEALLCGSIWVLCGSKRASVSRVQANSISSIRRKHTCKTTKRYLSLGVIMISYFFVRTLKNPSSSCVAGRKSKSASSFSLSPCASRTHRLVNGANVARQTLDATLDEPRDALEHLGPLLGTRSARIKHLTAASYHQSVMTAQHQTAQHALVRREPCQCRFDLGGWRGC